MFRYPSSPTNPLNLSPQELQDHRRKGRRCQLKRRHGRSSEDSKKRNQRHRERERRRSEPARIDYTPSPSPRTIGQESRRLQLERKIQRRSDDIERRDRRRISRELCMTEVARPAQSNTSNNPTTTPKIATSRFTTTPTKTIQNNVCGPTPPRRSTNSSSAKHPKIPPAKSHLTYPTWPPAGQAAAATTPPTRLPRPRRRPSNPPSHRS